MDMWWLPQAIAANGSGTVTEDEVKKPLITVFTASHQTTYLPAVYDSLLHQTYLNFEWILLLNKGARLNANFQEILAKDNRVKIHRHKTVKGVGHAKRLACDYGQGSIFVEMDHDDVLFPEALQEVVIAFAEHPEAGLVYSDCAQINADGSMNTEEFIATNGWEYASEEHDIVRLDTNPDTKHHRLFSLEATPHNISLIWFAPNHLRAFTKKAYDAVGGYDESKVVLDDQDLMSRLYQYGEFFAIDKLLYLQRVHEKNTQSDPKLNVQIQRETLEQYEASIQKNALAWAEREGLLAIDLGCGETKPSGYLGLDLVAGPCVDVVCDIAKGGIPVLDNSAGVIRCVDFLEHIPDRQFIMDEIWRVLAPGGYLLSLTPSTDGRGAFQDPTHVSYWNENSFWYYSDDKYRSYSPQTKTGKAKFQTSMVYSFNVGDGIVYVCANLIAIKDPNQPREGGQLKVKVEVEG